MQHLTKDRAPFLFRRPMAAPPAAVDPVEQTVVKDGVTYRILRQESLDRMTAGKYSRMDCIMMALGAGLVAGCAGFQFAADKPPVTVEKPVYIDKVVTVEKPVPVNSGCLFFCNQ